jgi:hypothetical protein
MEKKKQSMPTGKNEDVKFSMELADPEDLEAVKRAQKADQRQERKK